MALLSKNILMMKILIVGGIILVSCTDAGASRPINAPVHNLLASPTHNRRDNAWPTIDACYSISDFEATHISCYDDIMRTHAASYPMERDDHDDWYLHMMWIIFILASCVYCYLYHYDVYRREDDDDARKEVESKLYQTHQQKDTSVSVSTHIGSDTKCPIRENARRQGLVLYNGNWYSVSKFVPYHPGGKEVLLQYLGYILCLSNYAS